MSDGLRPPGEGERPRHGQSGSKSEASIYTSPCLEVAAFPTYANFFPVGRGGKPGPVSWAQVVFEVEVPEVYTKQQRGTLSHHTHWPHDLQFQKGFKTNEGLEWLYDDPSDLRLIGILVRGFDRGAEMFGTLNTQVSYPKPDFAWTQLLMEERRAQGLLVDGEGRVVPSAYAYAPNGRMVVGNFALREGRLGSSNVACALCEDDRVGRVAVFLNGQRHLVSAQLTEEPFEEPFTVGRRPRKILVLDPRDCGKMIFAAAWSNGHGKGGGKSEGKSKAVGTGDGEADAKGRGKRNGADNLEPGAPGKGKCKDTGGGKATSQSNVMAESPHKGQNAGAGKGKGGGDIGAAGDSKGKGKDTLDARSLGKGKGKGKGHEGGPGKGKLQDIGKAKEKGDTRGDSTAKGKCTSNGTAKGNKGPKATER